MADTVKTSATERKRDAGNAPAPAGRTVLAVDIGGSHVKVELSSGSERRAVESGDQMTAAKLVAALRDLTHDWHYDVVTMATPAPSPPIVLRPIPSTSGRDGGISISKPPSAGRSEWSTTL